MGRMRSCETDVGRGHIDALETRHGCHGGARVVGCERLFRISTGGLGRVDPLEYMCGLRGVRFSGWCCVSVFCVASVCVRASILIPMQAIYIYLLPPWMFRKTLRKVLRTHVRSPRPYTWRKVEGGRGQIVKTKLFQCVEKNKTLKQN